MPIDKIQKINHDEWYRFKAWDVLNNVMHYDVNYMLIKNEQDFLGVIFQSDIHEHDFSKWPPEVDYESKLIIMDYIKVRDKDGKKIHLFDFLQVKEAGTGKEYVGVVLFNSGGCPYAYDVNNIPERKEYNRAYFDNPDNEFRLVGNYYETPELRGADAFFKK